VGSIGLSDYRLTCNLEIANQTPHPLAYTMPHTLLEVLHKGHSLANYSEQLLKEQHNTQT